VATYLSLQASSDASSSELILRVDRAIKQNPHLNGNRVYFQEAAGVVVLHGKVATFFQKQMAQETLKRLEGVEKIINQLEVDWRSSVQC
jgi:osmotically-inducible protein OsmY